MSKQTRTTTHTTHFQSADTGLQNVKTDSVNLVVTSPPYPMVEMWDEIFSKCDPEIKNAIDNNQWTEAYNKMHEYLETIWSELIRVTDENCIIAINIGNATRNTNDSFQLYPNIQPIIQYFTTHGCQMLPLIHWNKASNKSSSFMGSGMIPTNAYVTNDHEYILPFRVGTGTRNFPPKYTERYESAYFWEERNNWFSDRWTVTGTTQTLSDTDGDRERSGAYPTEIPYRIINMYSIKGDTVLDPFLGTGTTQLAAAATGRNSVGFEIDTTLRQTIEETVLNSSYWAQKRLKTRVNNHKTYIDTAEYTFPYESKYGPVKTKQETDILFEYPFDTMVTQSTENTLQIKTALHPYIQTTDESN